MGVIEPQGFQVIIEEDDDNGGKKLKKDSDENVFKAPFPFENKALYQRNIEETQIKHLSGCSQMKENEGAVKPPPGYTQPEGFKSRHKSTAEIENGSDAGRPNPEFKDKEESDRTIFLSNLSFEVTEEEIREMMESSGPVKESVSKSILRDNELLKERPVYISMCDPNKKGHQFKYATDLIELFSTYGKVKEVRVVTFRNGKSKGIAYVDFENESDATNAIMKIDGMNFMGHFINVAFSNPPEKKKDMEPVSCLGGGVLKKQAPFLPRSILSKTRDVTEGSSTSSTANTTPKSNADFRNLFNKWRTWEIIPTIQNMLIKSQNYKKPPLRNFLKRLGTTEKDNKLPSQVEEKDFSFPTRPKNMLGSEPLPIKEKKLESIMKTELLMNNTKEEITVIPVDVFNEMKLRFKEFKTFLFPLPRKEGYEFIVVQFSGNEAHFTTLINFQAYKENSPECLTMVHYPELAEDKGIVLMVGEFDKNILNIAEAQCLANQIEMYYYRPSPSKIALMETFLKRPNEFKHSQLISEMDNIVLDLGAEQKESS
ncbi:ATPeAF1 [Lepeophtheirus salmonis]|uniref:ATPeAF1 n=1 Tax=Lepeophtheirus salmonis TaxID=72036 RepID=A0A7R8CGP9_LEPSM|nr:ATPeAF1 [Lepeophtheirus salmonis]CAF2812002.1 ATPeAF1 [Lepeophtheirus salmonis]